MYVSGIEISTKPEYLFRINDAKDGISPYASGMILDLLSQFRGYSEIFRYEPIR